MSPHWCVVLRKRIAAVAAAAIAAGCANAVMFSEVDRVSITAEGRPDSSQPVSVSIGLKERVVLVAPTGESNGAFGAAEGTKERYLGGVPTGATQSLLRAGEAVSVISSFEFRQTEDPALTRWFDDKIEIRSVFITGAAARNLTQKQSTAAAGAISLAKLTTTDFALVGIAYGNLNGDLARPDLKTRLDELVVLLPKSCEVELYAEKPMPPGTELVVEKVAAEGAPLDASSRFVALIAYWKRLAASEAALARVLAAGGPPIGSIATGAIDANGQPVVEKITAAMVAERRFVELQQRAAERKAALGRKIEAAPAVSELLELLRAKLGA